MITSRRVGIAISATMLVACAAAAAFAIWIAGLKPGPFADLTPEYRALQLAARPAPDTPDAWPDLLAALVTIRETEYALFHDPTSQPAQPPDFTPQFLPTTSFDDRLALKQMAAAADFLDLFTPEVMSAPSAAGSDDESPEDDDVTARRRESRQRAQRVVAALDTPRFDDLVTRLGRAEWALIEDGRADHVMSLGTPCRNLAALITFRMRQAWEAEQTSEIEREMRAAFGMLRVLYRQPTPVAGLIGHACQARLQAEVRRLIVSHPLHPDTIDRLWLAWEENIMTLPPWTRCLPGGRLDALTIMTPCYSGAHGGDGVFLPAHVEHDTPGPLQRLGNLRGYAAPSRREMTALINDFWNDVEALGDDATAAELNALSSTHVTRLDAIAPAHADFELPFADLLTVLAVDELERHALSIEIDAIGIRAMLAIEHHRATYLLPPIHLDDLALPWLLEPLPHINQRLRYRLIDPTTDPHGRAYLLDLPGFRDPVSGSQGEDVILNRIP